MKQELLDFILHKKTKYFTSKENDLDLDVFYDKVKCESLTVSDREVLIEDFLSNYLDFDANGEPVGDTLAIEAMIDYLVKYKKN